MKDEEMAEEIANKRCHEIMCYGHCSFNSPKHHRCGEWHREYNCALAGLKAGRPQWHDLRKAPNDLPQDFKYKRIYVNGCYDKAYYQANHDTWYGDNARYSTHAVTAWCDFDFFEEDD